MNAAWKKFADMLIGLESRIAALEEKEREREEVRVGMLSVDTALPEAAVSSFAPDITHWSAKANFGSTQTVSILYDDRAVEDGSPSEENS